MTKVKTREIIILTILLIFFADYMFYKYVFIKIEQEKSVLKDNIMTMDGTISGDLSLFYQGISVFGDIKKLKSEISKQEITNTILKEDVHSAQEVSDILKTFLLESGIALGKLSLSSSVEEGGIAVYTFDLSFVTNTKNLMKFIDKIENSVSFMDIVSYSLKSNPENLNVSMSVRSKYVVKR